MADPAPWENLFFHLGPVISVSIGVAAWMVLAPDLPSSFRKEVQAEALEQGIRMRVTVSRKHNIRFMAGLLCCISFKSFTNRAPGAPYWYKGYPFTLKEMILLYLL